MAEASFVKIGGELLSDSLLARVTVLQELNSHWWCEIECRQTSDQRFPAEDMLGKDLTVTAVVKMALRFRSLTALFWKANSTMRYLGAMAPVCKRFRDPT